MRDEVKKRESAFLLSIHSYLIPHPATLTLHLTEESLSGMRAVLLVR